MERITFCAACGEANSIKATHCENCQAPLRKVRDWRAIVQSIPRASPLALLVAAAVISLGIAVATYVLFG